MSVVEYKIRRVSEYEQSVYDAIARLLPLLNPNLAIPSEDYIREMFGSGNSHLFAAETSDGSIIGILTLGIYYAPSSKRAWIEDVVSDDNYRGIGVGANLVNAAIDFARSLNAAGVYLTSRSERVAANELYKKLGFVRYETNIYRLPL